MIHKKSKPGFLWTSPPLFSLLQLPVLNTVNLPYSIIREKLPMPLILNVLADY